MGTNQKNKIYYNGICSLFPGRSSPTFEVQLTDSTFWETGSLEQSYPLTLELGKHRVNILELG